MLTALSTALSAMNAQSTAIDVIGNNLANLSTVGFKSSSTQFYDLVSQSMGSGAQTQIGMGVATPIRSRVFSQGAIQSSSNATDIAIQGSGFLMVKDSSGALLYSRAGNLKYDATGNITDATGNLIQGWTATNGVVNMATPVGSLNVPLGSLKGAVATQNVSLTANLDASTPVIAAASQTAGNAWSTGIDVYDSLGSKHTVTLNFWNNGGGSWNWQATIPGADVGQATPATIGSGSLTFNSNGQLTAPTTAPTLSASGLVDGAANLSMKFNLFSGTTGLLTQFAQTSGQAANSQDGSAAAQLAKVSIANGGDIQATYSDGQNITVGQLAMANFVNPDTLMAVGNNAFQVSGATSSASIGTAGTGGRGQILGSSLESSTVDIATEFTSLMVDQRAYQANSKVITSADQINQDTINLIR